MSKPTRIQRQRTKGWRMPPDTVCVTRPGRWGNPFTVSQLHPGGALWAVRERDAVVDRTLTEQGALRMAVERYRAQAMLAQIVEPEEYEAWIAPLRGKNLACFCRLGQPCHADVLLELANADPTPAGIPIVKAGERE